MGKLEIKKDELKTVIDLLKQAYMEEDWKVVLECVDILQSEDESLNDDSEDDTDKYRYGDGLDDW